MNLIVIMSILYGLQFIVASVLNSLIIIAFLRSNTLQKVPTSILVSLVSFINLVQLFGVSLIWFINLIFDLHLETNSWTWCKFNSFFQLFTFHWFSFIFVSIPVDLCLNMKYVYCRMRYSSIKAIVSYASLLGFLAFSITFPVVYLLDDLRKSNSSSQSDPILICLAPFAFNYNHILIVISSCHLFYRPLLKFY